MLLCICFYLKDSCYWTSTGTFVSINWKPNSENAWCQAQHCHRNLKNSGSNLYSLQCRPSQLQKWIHPYIEGGGGKEKKKKKQPIEESRDISLVAVIKLTSTMSRQGCLDTPNAYGHRVKPCTRYCSLSVRRPSVHSSLTPPRLLESACLPFQSPLSPTFSMTISIWSSSLKQWQHLYLIFLRHYW